MYLSIDDVVPIDPDKAGTSVTDYLRDFGQVTFYSLVALAILTLVIAIVLAKKAGYSGWWGAIAVLVPPIGIILVLLFAMLKWPALKQRDEALGILDQNHLTLPSQERLAIKEAERKRSIEDAARKRMEKAQADREKADVEREKFVASEAKRAEGAPTPVSATPAAAGAAAAAVATHAKEEPEDDGASRTAGASARLAALQPGAHSTAAKPDPASAEVATPPSLTPKTPTVRPRASTAKAAPSGEQEPPAADDA